jgi:hypothetical protein
MTGNGPYFISPSVLGPDGRAVASDGSTFTGQLFFNPAAGTVGNLQRRYFSGPWFWNFDASMLKKFQIHERHNFELRMDTFNLMNHPSFYAGNETSSLTRFTVNNNTFGKITSTLNSARVIQFGLYYRF